jgi:hypothetical protein
MGEHRGTGGFVDFRGDRVKAPALAGFPVHHKDPLLADVPPSPLSNRGSAMLLGSGVAAFGA